MDFLLVLIELFSLRSYGRISVENRQFRSNGPVDPKFLVEGVAPLLIILLRRLG